MSDIQKHLADRNKDGKIFTEMTLSLNKVTLILEKSVENCIKRCMTYRLCFISNNIRNQIGKSTSDQSRCLGAPSIFKLYYQNTVKVSMKQKLR